MLMESWREMETSPNSSNDLELEYSSLFLRQLPQQASLHSRQAFCGVSHADAGVPLIMSHFRSPSGNTQEPALAPAACSVGIRVMRGAFIISFFPKVLPM